MKKSIFDILTSSSGAQSRIEDIPVSQIQPSPFQPRLRFDEEALQELSESIKEVGLIQPVTVRKVDGHYEIIAGERRFKACVMAGFDTVPCYIMSPSDEQSAQMALVENVQRENLSAIEEAKSYVQIMRQSGMTQEQVAKKIGKSQSAVANKIRLLNLPEEIQEGVMEGKVTERHARALLSVEQSEQKDVYHQVLEKGLNVRETEDLIHKMTDKKKREEKPKRTTKGFTRNVKIAINSVNQCVEMIHRLGISADVETVDDEDEVRMIIHLPK